MNPPGTLNVTSHYICKVFKPFQLPDYQSRLLVGVVRLLPEDQWICVTCQNGIWTIPEKSILQNQVGPIRHDTTAPNH
jgi:hypothetical protein